MLKLTSIENYSAHPCNRLLSAQAVNCEGFPRKYFFKYLHPNTGRPKSQESYDQQHIPSFIVVTNENHQLDFLRIKVSTDGPQLREGFSLENFFLPVS